MKTLQKTLLFPISLLIMIAFTSCSDLVETPIEEKLAEVTAFAGDDFELDILVYDCEVTNFSLLVTNPYDTPIEYFRQDIFEIEWIGDDGVSLSESIWLDCIGAGSYKVNVLNLKTDKSASAEITLYDKL